MTAKIEISRKEVLELVRQKIADKNPQFNILTVEEIMEYGTFEGVRITIKVD